KSQRLDQVQLGPGVRREPNHVAGVRRDLGVHQHDRDHQRSGASVLATTQFSTRAAPAALSVRANSASVAPVVMTSSTTATFIPFRSTVHVKAPRMLVARSSHGNAACGAVARVRRTPVSINLAAILVATARAISAAWLKPRSRCRSAASGIATT